ncbi:MAG: OmpA family protein [Rhodospirillaceae bacterium]|nr:OmpA family protein [Rhodospirillaceae bacterium]
MKRITVWAIGVIGVAALWGAAAAYKARPIERSIAAATAGEFNRRGLQRRFESLALDIDGRDVTVIGTAMSEADRRDALEAAAAAPGVGRVIDRVALAPEAKPFVFRALRNSDGSASLFGAVPAPAVMDRVVQLGRSVFGAQLGVSLRAARGAPEGDWFAAAKAAIEVMALVAQGEAVLADRELTISGNVSDDAALDSIDAMLKRSMPSGYTAVSKLATALDGELNGPPLGDAKACQSLVDRVVGRRDFRFEPGSTTLQEAPRRLIERLAVAMKRCAGLYLEIYAASDTHAGDPAANLRLSEARAQVLLEALVRQGVARERMVALGRGRLDPRERAAGPDVEFRIADAVVPVVRPFVWRIEKSADGTGLISGHYPTTTIESDLLDAARKVLTGKVTDSARPGQGVPPGDWLAAGRLAVFAVSQLQSGTAALVDYDIVVTGVARDDLVAKAIGALVADRAPQGFRAKVQIATLLDERLKGAKLANAGECQALLDTVSRTGSVEFVFDGPALLDRQRQLFDRLVAATRRCPDLNLEVAGHAPGTGDPEAARVLSERWAQAVVEALAGAGAARERLRPIGYGNTKPVADAGTEAGRQRNRRITFRFIP